MATHPARAVEEDDRQLFALFGLIGGGDRAEVTRRLDSAPGLAHRALRVGASRATAAPYFLAEIGHIVYAGDTALHVAAAAYQRDLAESLLARGALVTARNRRGATPLHYAADAGPGARHRDRTAQGGVIGVLIAAGADPDAVDRSGVTALHRAVRSRCSTAVGALIDHGADPLLRNGSGSTPLHLAVQNTGKSGSGSAAAHDEQLRIIALLLAHGAKPTDPDAHGRSVAAAVMSEEIRTVLGTS